MIFCFIRSPRGFIKEPSPLGAGLYKRFSCLSSVFFVKVYAGIVFGARTGGGGGAPQEWREARHPVVEAPYFLKEIYRSTMNCDNRKDYPDDRCSNTDNLLATFPCAWLSVTLQRSPW